MRLKLRPAVLLAAGSASLSGPMTVGALARRAGISADAVRYYVRTGLLQPTRNAANGYRQFGADELRRLRFIRQAQSLGFTLADIGTILQQADRYESPCPLVRDLIRRRIQQAGEELNQLVALRNRMQRAVRQWEAMPDGTPDGREICRLIESIEPEPQRHDAAPRGRSARKSLRAKRPRTGGDRKPR